MNGNYRYSFMLVIVLWFGGMGLTTALDFGELVDLGNLCKSHVNEIKWAKQVY